jgi:hypothetical protein
MIEEKDQQPEPRSVFSFFSCKKQRDQIETTTLGKETQIISNYKSYDDDSEDNFLVEYEKTLDENETY